MTRGSDLGLGALVLVLGLVAVLDAAGVPTRRGDPTSPELFQTAVGGLLLVTGLVLLARGALFARAPAEPWRPAGVALVAGMLITLEVVAVAGLPAIADLALRMGPPEYAGVMLLRLATAVALASMSRARAAGMALLGLLLSMVGIDVVTGMLRLTFGLEPLADGLGTLVVALGVIVAADAFVCLISPSLLIATYARRVTGWRTPAVTGTAAAGMRVAAAMVLAAASFTAYELSARVWDVGGVLVFGLFGIACKLLGWNRLVLIAALAAGASLEQAIRQTLLLSGGDPAILLSRPISATLLTLAALVLVCATVLSARRARRSLRFAPLLSRPAG